MLPNHHSIDGAADISLKQLGDQAGAAIVQLAFRVVPKRPNIKKWSKLGPSLDWHLVAVGAGLLPAILRGPSFKEVKVQAIREASNMVAGCGHAVESEEFHWHRVQGQRYAHYRDHIEKPIFMPTIIILCLVFEPLRFITKWFFRHASVLQRARHRAAGRCAPLCDLVWPQRSVIVRVQTYLSFLLSGRAPRLKILYGRTHRSYAEWARDCPSENEQFRRTVVAASSLVEMRHMRPAFSAPWPAAAAADHRRPLENRRAIVMSYLATPSECRDQLWSDVVLEWDISSSVDKFFEEPMQEFLTLWSWSVVLTVAPCEWHNSRNRQRADMSETWEISFRTGTSKSGFFSYAGTAKLSTASARSSPC